MDDLPIELRRLDPVRRAALRTLSAGVLTVVRLARRGRVDVGRGVIANHRLRLLGPGRIEIGDGADLYAFRGQTRLVARRPDAVIRIGKGTRLNGSFVQADRLVEIGPDCIVGEAHLLDTDMHSVVRDRRTNSRAPVRTAPVVLEANVWVARGAIVLPGVRIGEGSVVGYGSVVTRDVPPGVVVAGNPAKVVRRLD